MRATPKILLGDYEWKKDNYNRKRLLKIKYDQKERAKAKIHEKPFYQMHYGQEPCNSSKKVLAITGLCSVSPLIKEIPLLFFRKPNGKR